MLITKFLEIKWHPRNKKRYVDAGYKFTKYKDIFIISIEHLSETCNAIVNVECDYCNKEYQKTYRNYLIQNREAIIKKDSCDECKGQKIRESNLANYGVSNVSQLTVVKDKKFNSSMSKYGVPNVWQSPEVRKKIEETNIEKYGCPIPSQADSVKQKIIETSIKRFGFPTSLQHPEIKEKIKITNLKRYGFTNPAKNNEIKAKAIRTFTENGTTKTSKPQIALFNLLNEKGYNVEINYSYKWYSLDIGLFHGDTKINIEYDGWYWHQDKAKDERRDKFLIERNWNVFRIKSGRLLPPFEEIKSILESLLNSEVSYAEIICSDWKEVTKSIG